MRYAKDAQRRVLEEPCEAAAKPAVAVVILNWNGYGETERCLASLEKSDYQNLEVLVVDNGSHDRSADKLREEFPGLPVIRNEENFGFALGNNVGIRVALAGGADYVLLINNDAELDSSAVSAMVDAAESDPTIGIVGGLIHKRNKPNVIEHAGGNLNLSLGYHGRARGFGKEDVGQFRATEEVDWVSGCALMVSRRFVNSVGLLDPDYFCYCEDVDWCVRARGAGFKVVIAPGAKVYHKGSSSSIQTDHSSVIYYYVRNQLLLLSRHAPISMTLGRWLRNASVVLSTIAFVLFVYNGKKSKGLRAIVRGARDFRRGRFGRTTG